MGGIANSLDEARKGLDVDIQIPPYEIPYNTEFIEVLRKSLETIYCADPAVFSHAISDIWECTKSTAERINDWQLQNPQ